MSEINDTPGDNQPGDGLAPAIKQKAPPWKKGQSGNPRGRPVKSPEARAVEALARAESAGALEVVLSIMRSAEKDRDRLAAAMAVIERGIGKAGDTVEPIPVPVGASLAERAQAIADAAMQGACSVGQAASLLSCLASVAKVREVEELEQRITALESKESTK